MSLVALSVGVTGSVAEVVGLMGASTEGRGRLQVLLSVRKPKSKVGLSSARLEVVVFLLFRPPDRRRHAGRRPSRLTISPLEHDQ